MPHFNSLQQRFLIKFFSYTLPFLLSCGLTLSISKSLQAANTSANAPVELKNMISQLETAANQKNIKQVMNSYSPDFKNSDGLNYNTLSQSLTKFWEQFSQVKYTTTIDSWEKQGDKLIAMTTTTIQGTGKLKGRPVTLNSTIKSRQQFQGQKLLYQEILSERNEITSGQNPPKVEIRIPDKVKAGQEFDFDVIVTEPLGDSLLAGAAMDEKVEGESYLDPKALELELLPGGGIFKRAKAPITPENHWVSAILIRGDGIILITQRVKVEK
ncbi:hypothetical protein C7H19_11350 [Aphanothece hegewaldii CCALA 016]|uniref:Nuclear transport factor 2 family protein n=1 Tax=Aphanothece hegewaldii CCALA 016 TaxID=2107694 RepID=A0A2T1LY47_9CHRO|nr:hypothetical protein [Aphanothece hegewaldii]PSF37306.1 hypothetical protein C7H19_11350 [Aphanothece hegewaldii CCALA 016]